LRRFVAEEDRDDDYDFHSGATSKSSKEMTFVESVFAFVFGRGDPNDDMEHRRWRAVSALLRVNRGAVFAEQVAPFLDEYLLDNDGDGNGGYSAFSQIPNRLLAALASVASFLPLPAATRRAWLRFLGNGRDGVINASRMHEGYMLKVCAKFGGHAEASDDGRLVYVFPALRFTTIDDDESGDAANGANGASGDLRTDTKISRPALLPPPLLPPLYEKQRPTWEGGEKTGQVAALGALNLFLVILFKKVGGTNFRAPRRALGVRARATMGRRAGGGLLVGEGARVAGTGARVVVTNVEGSDGTTVGAPTARQTAEAARAAVAAAKKGLVPTSTPPRAPPAARSCTRRFR
jgi:hypothetical protein